jgi:hypothetical protein
LKFLGTRLANYLAAVLVAYMLASVMATLAVIASLGRMGVDVGTADRLKMILEDIGGMAGMFLPMVAFALLAAFLVTALLCRWLRRWRRPLYILAGAAALLAIHIALNLAFGLTPIAAARTGAGLFLQSLAGAAGGLTYILLLERSGRIADSPKTTAS